MVTPITDEDKLILDVLIRKLAPLKGSTIEFIKKHHQNGIYLGEKNEMGQDMVEVFLYGENDLMTMSIYMKVIGKMVNVVVKESLNQLMEHIMKENGKTIKHIVLVYLNEERKLI